MHLEIAGEIIGHHAERGLPEDHSMNIC